MPIASNTIDCSSFRTIDLSNYYYSGDTSYTIITTNSTGWAYYDVSNQNWEIYSFIDKKVPAKKKDIQLEFDFGE